MTNAGYFIIDGSHLFARIYEIWRRHSGYNNKRLHIDRLSEALLRTWTIYTGPARRVVFYFRKDDTRLKEMLIIPQVDKPGLKNHWQIKQCGEKIATVPQSQLNKIQPKYRDHFMRGEKGLDIRLACDSLSLVAGGRASDLVFLVNDRDYVPLFEAIQSFGANVYLTDLDSKSKIAKSLAELADRYLTLDSDLPHIFDVQEPTKNLPTQPLSQP